MAAMPVLGQCLRVQLALHVFHVPLKNLRFTFVGQGYIYFASPFCVVIRQCLLGDTMQQVLVGLHELCRTLH